jgi:hypothetical protein
MQSFRIYLIVPCLIILSGCGLTVTQRVALNDFGTATAAAGATAQKELTYMRDETITMKGQYLAFIPYGELRDRQKEQELQKIVKVLQKKKKELQEVQKAAKSDKELRHVDLQRLMREIDDLVAKQRQSEPDYMQLDDMFTLERVRTREQAAATLESYGSLLTKLADDSSSQQVLTSFDNLTAAFKALPQQDRVVTDAQLNIIGSAVKTIGGWFINAAKKKVIKEVVEAYYPQVNKLCELLAGDFDRHRNRMATRFVSVTLQLDSEAADKYLSADHYLPPENILVRSLALNGLKTAKINTDYYETVLPGVAGSFQKMQEAHDTLRVKLRNDTLSPEDIKQFTDSVRNLLELIKLFQTQS